VTTKANLEQPASTGGVTVQLRYASLPSVLGLFAAHYWFVVWDTERCDRWEVWQTKNAGGQSIGHVHRNLKSPDAGVGGGPPRIAAEWTGTDAADIKAVLEHSTNYRHIHRYWPWPGPNSNTFVSWALRRAGIRHRLGWMALGKRFPA